MIKGKFGVVVLIVLLGLGCKDKKGYTTDKSNANKEVSSSLQVAPDTWISSRVEKAKKKLLSSDAGKIIWSAMEAHGGLANYYKNGFLSFRFDYQPLDGKERRDSYQTIDTWSNKARHHSITDTTNIFGWDGKDAWIKQKDSTSFKYDTKFWALTPYYFVSQPFVFDGAGVNLEMLGQITFKGKLENVVKVTFDAGTGDAPDDYYILYFSEDTKQLEVIRYIVSYPEYFERGKHAPEKFMEITSHTEVDGVVFPKQIETYWLVNNNEKGDHITTIHICDISFRKSVAKDYFLAPEGAKILE